MVLILNDIDDILPYIAMIKEVLYTVSRLIVECTDPWPSPTSLLKVIPCK